MHTSEHPAINGQRYAWIGFTLGIACMAGLFIFGLTTGKPQLPIMAGSIGVVLGVVWSSTSAAAKAAARRDAAEPATPEILLETGQTHPTADTARDLLQEASRLGSASRAGASWPHITLLLGLGAISSLTMICFWFVARYDESMVSLPLIALLLWLGILLVFMLVFGRSTKRGFARRWVVFMSIWGGLWALGVILTTTLFAGELWFTIVIAAALTLNSTVGAWLEASK